MKRFVLLLFFVFPFIYSSAQTFMGGFYAGATMSGIQGLQANNDNSFDHLGFTLAGTVSTKISHSTSLQMEIRYFQRGASQPPIIDSGTGTYSNNYFKLTLDYIDVVLGIKHAIHFNLKNVSTDKYGIEAGVSVGALLAYSYEVNSINYNLAVQSMDISPFVGIYYNVTPHFYVEGRYSNSIESALVQSNVANPYFLYYNSFNDGHNLNFSLTLGFIFGANIQQQEQAPPPPQPQQ